MKKTIIYCGVTLLMFVEATFAQITETPDLISVKEIFRKADSNTLIIFDVDHVLIMPTDEYTLNRNPFRKQLWTEMGKRLSKEELTFYTSIAVSSAQWQLVDPYITNIIKALNDKHIPSIALTSLSTGRVGIIDKMEDLRIKELNSVGISFKNSSPLKGEVHAYALEADHGVPLLKEGIILTAEVDKALVLEYMLHDRKYFPESIIFIDDQVKNLESISKLCSKLKIKFQGIHYTAASLIPTLIVDESLERTRFKILEEEKVWLSYSTLINRLKRSIEHVTLTHEGIEDR
jgi:hypothetical protein